MVVASEIGPNTSERRLRSNVSPCRASLPHTPILDLCHGQGDDLLAFRGPRYGTAVNKECLPSDCPPVLCHAAIRSRRIQRACAWSRHMRAKDRACLQGSERFVYRHPSALAQGSMQGVRWSPQQTRCRGVLRLASVTRSPACRSSWFVELRI